MIALISELFLYAEVAAEEGLTLPPPGRIQNYTHGRHNQCDVWFKNISNASKLLFVKSVFYVVVLCCFLYFSATTKLNLTVKYPVGAAAVQKKCVFCC